MKFYQRLTQKFFIILVLNGLSCLISAINEKDFNSTKCRELGFYKDGLMCSSCNELREFKLEDLALDCKQCCVNDLQNDDDNTKYVKAVLQICYCNLGRFPQIEEFVKQNEKKSKYRNLEIRQVYGKPPTLVLYDRQKEENSMGIENWTTNTLEEYLAEVLLK